MNIYIYYMNLLFSYILYINIIFLYYLIIKRILFTWLIAGLISAFSNKSCNLSMVKLETPIALALPDLYNFYI